MPAFTMYIYEKYTHTYIYIYIYIYNVCVCVCVCACVCAKLLQQCLTVCDPMACSLEGSSVHGFLQARILEWVGMHFSRGSSQPRDRTHISYVSCTGRQVLYHPGGTVVKNLLAMQETQVRSPGLGRSPREVNSNPLLYSCLGNSVDRGAWQATQSMASQRVGHD